MPVGFIVAGSAAVPLEQGFVIFVHSAGDSSPTHHEGHSGILNVQQLMLDGTPGLMPV